MEEKTLIELWESMKPVVSKLIDTYYQNNPDKAFEKEDYWSVAFLKFFESIGQYETIREKTTNNKHVIVEGKQIEITNMKLQTFIYWHLQKVFERGEKRNGIICGNGREMVYHIYKGDRHLMTLTRGQYARMKKSIAARGMEVKTEYIFRDLHSSLDEKDGNPIERIADFRDYLAEEG